MWNAISPGFELVSPCPILATITITPLAPPLHARLFSFTWMDCCGLHEWPVRSPDLISYEFFLWEQVYSTKPMTLEDLEGRIQGVMSSTRLPSEISWCDFWEAWEADGECLCLYPILYKTPCYTLSSHFNFLYENFKIGSYFSVTLSLSLYIYIYR